MAGETIFRPQTEREKDLNHGGFINIGPVGPYAKADMRVRAKDEMIPLFDSANRYRISHTKPDKLIDTFKLLSCKKCFQFEHKKGLTNADDFKKQYKKYQGRHILEEVVYRDMKNGIEREKSVAIRFKRCVYCGGCLSIGFSNHELSPELFETFKKMSVTPIADGVEDLIIEMDGEKK